MPDGDEISDEEESPGLKFLAHPRRSLFLMSGPLNILCNAGQSFRTPCAPVVHW